MLGRIRQDIRYALRTLRRAPGFAAAVLLTLALGIGANVATFSVVNGILLRPLPYERADRIVQLANGDAPSTLSEPELIDLARDATVFSSMGAYAFADGNVTGTGREPERVRMARATAGLFSVLRAAPWLGRPFTAEEDRPGAEPVVVLSHALFARWFGDDPAAIGRQIVINGAPRTVVGVMPPHFDFPSAGVAVWTPLALNPSAPGERRNHSYRLISRLAPDATVEDAQAQVQLLRKRWEIEHPTVYDPTRPLVIDVTPLEARLLGSTRPWLLALLGAVGVVLLVCCVNVANLLLARGEVRRKELAIRTAIGASPGRVTVQLLVENTVLAVSGGMMGLLMGWAAERVLVALAPASIPRVDEIAMDLHVLAFTGILSVGTGILFGLWPAWRTLRDRDGATLRDGSKTSAHADGPFARRMRTSLAVVQIGLAVALLMGAGVMTRSLVNLLQTDLGFSSEGVITARLALPRVQYDEPRMIAAYDELVTRLAQSPNVVRAAAMAWAPMVEGGGNWSVVGDDALPTASGHAPLAQPQQVTPAFFAALSIPIARGRSFEPSDGANAPLVAIVNETMARQLWGDTDAVGRRLRMSAPGAPWATIVGVVRDTRVEGINDAPPPVMYFPHAQAGQSAYFTSPTMTLVLKVSGSFAPIVPEIRRVVRELDPDLPVSNIQPLDQVVGSTIQNRNFITALLGGFAVLAIILSGIGIYGVIAYGVVQRRFEIGVRMALGATRARVLRTLAGEGVLMVGSGLALGGVAGVLGSRLLRSMLVGVDPVDAVTLAGVSTLVVLVTLLAFVMPARRAMRINPTEALRGGNE